MNSTQEQILRYFRNRTFDSSVDLDKQLSSHSETCLVGMVETGEATLEDMVAVGGVVLAARIAKRIEG